MKGNPFGKLRVGVISSRATEETRGLYHQELSAAPEWEADIRQGSQSKDLKDYEIP